jgi:arsenite methyltransferase
MSSAKAANAERRPTERSESLFERFPWLYAICRDHLFRDDTELMATALWPTGDPPEGSSLLEVGCGPGFYARRLAACFGYLRVTGIDRSTRQLRRARSLAAADDLGNCAFVRADARALPMPAASFDALIASRLFLVLPERRRALAEMYRVLRPGGRCFIAEPRSALRADLPLQVMWLLARLAAPFSSRNRTAAYREPGRVDVMDGGEFGALVGSQPWKVVRRRQDRWYQYAVCEKASEQTGT